MRLQHKVFTFQLPSGDKPISRLLTSKVVVNNKESDMLLSDLFYSRRRENGNTINGHSVLQLLNEKGEIEINEKIYTISFQGENENFNLFSVTDPKNFTLEDKELSEDELLLIENSIVSSAPVVEEVSQQPDPILTESSSQEGDSTGESEEEEEEEEEVTIFENEDYEFEKSEAGKEGYVEYNTVPKSNVRLLVKESALPEKEGENTIVVVEIQEDDYEIGIREEYNLEINQDNKTFSWTQK